MKKVNQISDADLVIKYKSGDRTALAVLVKRWHLQFCKFSFWIVKDSEIAKDIAQESWSVIMMKLTDLQEPNKFKSWAISIVNRKSIDWIRAKNRENIQFEKLCKENKNLDFSEDSDDNTEIKKELLISIEKLPINQQIILKLFYTQSYSLNEISQLLEISIGTVKSRLFNAREKLKIILKHSNYEK